MNQVLSGCAVRAAIQQEGRTEVEIEALVDAMWQLLDDMGRNGQHVCMAAKAQARIAFEPFQDPHAPTPMDLDYARSVVANARHDR